MCVKETSRGDVSFMLPKHCFIEYYLSSSWICHIPWIHFVGNLFWISDYLKKQRSNFRGFTVQWIIVHSLPYRWFKAASRCLLSWPRSLMLSSSHPSHILSTVQGVCCHGPGLWCFHHHTPHTYWVQFKVSVVMAQVSDAFIITLLTYIEYS